MELDENSLYGVLSSLIELDFYLLAFRSFLLLEIFLKSKFAKFFFQIETRIFL
jgi:hypothetical protein